MKTQHPSEKITENSNTIKRQHFHQLWPPSFGSNFGCLKVCWTSKFYSVFSSFLAFKGTFKKLEKMVFDKIRLFVLLFLGFGFWILFWETPPKRPFSCTVTWFWPFCPPGCFSLSPWFFPSSLSNFNVCLFLCLHQPFFNKPCVFKDTCFQKCES